MRRGRARALLAGLVVAGSLLVGVGEAAASPTSGINDWSCRPASAQREPVVMLHGLGGSGIGIAYNWTLMAPAVAAAGYCVFTPSYGEVLGIGGVASMRDSAAEVADFVERVRRETGAQRVNIVGHSEGTTVAAYYMKFLGGDARVRNFVGFGPNYRGTTLHGLNVLVRAIPGLGPLVGTVCGACDEFLPPNAFLDDLARGGITRPGPRYTNIVSRYDTVVVPNTGSGFINEPGVTNILLQDRCWLDFSGHLAMAVDPNVVSHVIWALRGQSGARPACVPFVAPL